MFFDRPKSGELAVLVHLDFPHPSFASDPREFEELALSAGADPVAYIIGKRSTPDARLFIGSGKLQEIVETVRETGAQLVIFDHALSPSQERNLEQILQCRVLDRIGLILDIFAQRARTYEGKLQVELAQLRHTQTRLIRGWTHLERQRGGIGLRGPGETQLETDRRLLRERVKSIEKRLEKVRSQRVQGRRARQRSEIPVISLCGYTNAGKSTLFNCLTRADVLVADQLFATLDSTMRRVELPGFGTVILADTVGFVSHLPHQLVEAFRGTLEEVVQADLLVHVIDAHSDNRSEQVMEVESVLQEIGAGDVPSLQVYNKIDCIEGCEPRTECDASSNPQRVWLSALTGAGVPLLAEALVSILTAQQVEITIPIPPEHARLRARLYDIGAVLQETITDDGVQQLHVRLPRYTLERLWREAGLDSQPLITLVSEVTEALAQQSSERVVQGVDYP